MFNFNPSEEQQMIIDTARRFTKEKIIDTGLDMKLDKSGDFPHDVYKEMWESGLVNLEIPESAGGPGLSCIEQSNGLGFEFGAESSSGVHVFQWLSVLGNGPGRNVGYRACGRSDSFTRRARRSGSNSVVQVYK